MSRRLESHMRDSEGGGLLAEGFIKLQQHSRLQQVRSVPVSVWASFEQLRDFLSAQPPGPAGWCITDVASPGQRALIRFTSIGWLRASARLCSSESEEHACSSKQAREHACMSTICVPASQRARLHPLEPAAKRLARRRRLIVQCRPCCSHGN